MFAEPAVKTKGPIPNHQPQSRASPSAYNIKAAAAPKTSPVMPTLKPMPLPAEFVIGELVAEAEPLPDPYVPVAFA